MKHGPHEKYVFNLLLDNCFGENLFRYADEGKIPFIKKYLLGKKLDDGCYERAVISRNSVCPFPSSSANGHTTLITGSYNGKSGVLNSSYWDLYMKNGIPKHKQLDKVKVKAIKIWETEISENTKTIFEYINDTASYHLLSRGADVRFVNKKLVLKMLPTYLRLKIKGTNNLMDDREFWRLLLNKLIKENMKQLNKKGLPKYSFLLHLPTDGMAHHFGYDSPEYFEGLQFLDEILGTLIEGIDDKKGNHYSGLIEMGIFDKTMFVIMSDHASKPFEQSKLFDMAEYLRNNSAINILDSHIRNYSRKIKKKNSNLLTDFRKADCLIDQIGEFIQIYLRENCKESNKLYFNNNIQIDSLKKYKLYKNNEINWIEFLRKSKCMGRIIVRESSSDIQQNKNYKFSSDYWQKKGIQTHFERNYQLHIFSKDGESIVKRRFSLNENNVINNLETEYSYKIIEGNDPLLFTDNEEISGIINGNFYKAPIWLERSFLCQMPNIFERYFGYFDNKNSPNLILVAERGFSFYNSSDPNDPMKKKIYNHDAEYIEQSLCPVIFSGPNIKRGSEITFLKNVDILPTIVNWLGIEQDLSEIDGNIIDL